MDGRTMTDDRPTGTSDNAAERALEEVEKKAASDEEDHEGRLESLERLHKDLEGELAERDLEPRPRH
jgi:hypothetical protein